MPMTSEMDSIVYQFFQKTNLEEVELHQLEQFVSDFPYCVTGQLLLAKKYRDAENPSFSRQASKTAIYFTYPHWLNRLLLTDDKVQAIENKVENENVTISDDNRIVAEEPTIETEIPAEENILPEPKITEIIPSETVNITGSEDQNKYDEDPQETNETNTADEKIDKDVNNTPESEEDDIKPEISAVKLKSILDSPPQSDQNGELQIPIEPLHTVDYFASQGIKISADIEGQDRLSIKLRSFTDWLKTMKKIHPEKLESEMDPGAQTAIQHIAEHSNETKEVVTEAMAEVFAKQGLNNKALEVYRKLSLLNPDKRVYFAAKISKLNDL